MLILHALFPRGGVTTPPIGQEPDPTPIPTAISLTPAQFTVRAGNLTRLTGVVYSQFGDPMPGEAITYTSSDTGVATVNSSGIVTGVAAGSCTITATSGPFSATSDAIVEAAPTVTGWSDTRYPHSPNGLLFTYTDFRTSYLSDTLKATEMAFIPTKADKVISGGEPAGGYPVGLTHQPYILTSWIAACVHDTDYWRNPRSKTEALWLDYCAANSVDPEDGYLHYPTGATTYAMEIVSIDISGLVTLKYDFVTYADILQDGDTVTIAGATNAAFNGTWTISGVGVTGGAFDKNGDLTRAKTVFTIAHTGDTAGASGTVTRATDGAKTKRNRYVFLVGDGGKEFPPPRWVINHANADRIAFERDRLQKLVDGTYPDAGFTPEGFYVDEISQNTWGKFMSLVTVEYPSGGGSQWLADMAAFYATLAADWPDNPWIQEIGTGSYTKPETTTLIDTGPRCTQLEQLVYTRKQFEWMVGNTLFEWCRDRLAAGDYIEWCTPFTPQDNIAGGGGNYATDPIPAGVRAPSNIRMYAGVYCLALLAHDATKPYHIAVNVMNGSWLPSDPNQGLNNRWIGLFEVDLGAPTEAPARVVTGQKDSAGQGVTIGGRHFERGYVIYRRVDANPDTCDYTATYTYTPPASTGTGGKWCRVRSDGTLDSPASSFGLASDEGLILLPAP